MIWFSPAISAASNRRKGIRNYLPKLFPRLKPGGIFVVNDFVPNEERTEPTFALRFSVYTLTHTPEGECWTLSQYSDWMKKAGFNSITPTAIFPRLCRGRR